jgi:peptidoglycan hydrolase-like protein with peptidoglycan-binding domain
VGNAPDDGPRLRTIPVWPVKPTKKVNLLIAYWQFRAKKPKPRVDVKRIQWVLNKKGYHVGIDGVAGPQTRAAYKAWEKSLKVKNVDGVPSRYTLRKLGEGYFNVGLVAWEGRKKRLASKKKK